MEDDGAGAAVRELRGVPGTLFIPLAARVHVSRRFPDYFHDRAALSLARLIPAAVDASSSEYGHMASVARYHNLDEMTRAFAARRGQCRPGHGDDRPHDDQRHNGMDDDTHETVLATASNPVAHAASLRAPRPAPALGVAPRRRHRLRPIASAEERRVNDQHVQLVRSHPLAPARRQRRDLLVAGVHLVEVRLGEDLD